MAGVPFETLEEFVTRNTANLARDFIEAETDYLETKSEVEKVLASRRHNLSKEQFRAWRKVIRQGAMPPSNLPVSWAFTDCWRSARRFAAADEAFGRTLAQELDATRQALWRAAARSLPRYFVFSATGLRELLAVNPNRSLLPRKKGLRACERHLLLYLQRLCAKNDTLSEFGPQTWGSLEAGTSRIKLNLLPGIARRETFLERWTAYGAAAAINADPETQPEIAPRLHPTGRIEGQNYVFTETGESLPLDSETLAILKTCDGLTPAHSLGVSLETLRSLQERGLLRWEMEVPAIEPHAFDILVSDIAMWRNEAARSRWLERLTPISVLPARFAATDDTSARIAIMSEASERLRQLGAHKESTRFLYTATNPIGEECFRECHISVGEDLLAEVTRDASPWIDFWRDNYAFVASRISAGLRSLLEQMPLKNGAAPLPAFMKHCAESKMSLIGPGLVTLGHLAFREVKEAFCVMMQGRENKAEVQLAASDCQFVRQNFTFPKFDEYTYPSADLQLSASSIEAVERGNYEWILAELHPAVALIHHGFLWSCPDKEALSAAIRATVCGRPNLHFGFYATDFTATTATQFYEVLPDLTCFVMPQRGRPGWWNVSPSEAEVFMDEETKDVGLRHRVSGEYLGSFTRSWVIPLGFHPFNFSLGAHTPRLRCGKIIVQRRAWIVALEELGGGDFTGISRDLVVAVERLRAARDLPRYVYIRPTERALRRSGGEGRDKDTKPVFIDLESYLFLEIFHRWLTKAGELELTEMLPDPEHLLWKDKDGRHTFEIRTLIVPR
jgi:hypothetical protein